MQCSRHRSPEGIVCSVSRWECSSGLQRSREGRSGYGSRIFRTHFETGRRKSILWRRLSLGMLMSGKLMHLTLWTLEHSFYVQRWSGMPGTTVNRFSMLQWRKQTAVRVLHPNSMVSRSDRLRNSWRERTIRNLGSLTRRTWWWCWDTHTVYVTGCYLVSHWQVSLLSVWSGELLCRFSPKIPFPTLLLDVVSDVARCCGSRDESLSPLLSCSGRDWRRHSSCLDERPYQIRCTQSGQ